MAEKEDFSTALRLRIIEVIQREPGMPYPRAERIAQQVVGELESQYGGERVYVPCRRYDRDAVIADLSHMPVAKVCTKHGISRSTAKRIKGTDRNSIS